MNHTSIKLTVSKTHSHSLIAVVKEVMIGTSYGSLAEKRKKRYTKKRCCVGLSLKDDPYLTENEAKFARDMTTWPKIEYGHYIIKRPGVHTQEHCYHGNKLMFPTTPSL